MILYIILLIFGLYYIGIWKTHQLKNTIIWALSVGVLSLFKINSIKNDPKFFNNLVLDNLKLIAIIQFILVFNTFSFLIEFLLLPIYFVIGSMLTVTQNKKQFHLVEKILNWIIILIGTITIIYSIFMLVMNFGEFANEQTLYDFIIPPILSFFYIPFIFIMMIIFSYELVFVRIKFHIKNPKVRKFAKFYSIVKFHFRIKVLERWAIFMQFYNTTTKEDIKNTVEQILKMVSIEKNPSKIPLKDGWSPYEAKNFLLDEGLETGYYQPTDQDEWFASSPLIQVDDSIFSNSISYCIEGNEFSAIILKVILDVYNRKTAFKAHKKLLSCVRNLLKSALNIEITNELQNSIIEEKNQVILIDHYSLNIIKHEWNKKNNGYYTIKFILSNH